MELKNPLFRLDKHHTQVLKNIEKLDVLIADIESNGVEAMQMHHHNLVRLRHRILNDSVIHFKQEEDVVFPEILEHFPDSKETIMTLLKDHQKIQTLYHDLLQTIDEEKAEAFVEIAQSAAELLQRHITREDAFFKEVGGDWLKPELFEEFNHRMNIIEKEIKEEMPAY